jgi:predicted GNAT superfamily acetyltransferase
MSEVVIRAMETLAEFKEGVRLQKEIWGFEDVELLPLRLFVVASKIGGQVLGAFDGERMVGFLLAIPGLKKGTTYLHSHMMGVIPEYRNQSLGRRMKLAQRADALERGVRLVEWTFDPLEIKNAFLNIEKLGAVVRRYVLNQYGTTTSHLHGGLPTDRCVAEWHLDHPRVLALLEKGSLNRPVVEGTVEVPVEIGDLRVSDPKKAREIQQRVSDGFGAMLDRGLAVTGFERTAGSGIYQFGRFDA